MGQARFFPALTINTQSPKCKVITGQITFADTWNYYSSCWNEKSQFIHLIFVPGVYICNCEIRARAVEYSCAFLGAYFINIQRDFERFA